MDIKRLVLLHGEKPIVGLVILFALYMVAGNRMQVKDTPDIPSEVKRIADRYKNLKGPGIGEPLPNKEQEWRYVWFDSIGRPELRRRDVKFWVAFDRPPVGPPPKIKKKESVFVDPPKEVKAEGFRTFARITWRRHPNHIWRIDRSSGQKTLFQKIKKGSRFAQVKGFLIARKDLSTNKVTILNDGKPIAPQDLVRSVKKIRVSTERAPGGEVPGEMPPETPPGEMPPGYDEGAPPEMPPEGIPGEGPPEEGEYYRRAKRPGVGKFGIIWYASPTGDFIYYDRDVEKGHKYTYNVTIIVDSPKEKGERAALKWSEEVEIKPSLLWTFQGASTEGASIAVFRFVELEHVGGYWQSANAFVRCGDPIGFKTERKVYSIDLEKAKKETNIENASELDATLAKRFLKSEKKIVDFGTGAVVADMFKGIPVLTVATSAGEKAGALCSVQTKDLLLFISPEGNLEQMLSQKRKDFIGTHDIKLAEPARTKARTPARAVRGPEELGRESRRKSRRRSDRSRRDRGRRSRRRDTEEYY